MPPPLAVVQSKVFTVGYVMHGKCGSVQVLAMFCAPLQVQMFPRTETETSLSVFLYFYGCVQAEPFIAGTSALSIAMFSP